MPLKEVLTDVARWQGAGQRAAIARVVGVVGSSPREIGAAMAVSEDGEVAGSVSGGCVEGAVVTEALGILQGDGAPRLVTFGYSDDEAFVFGTQLTRVTRELAGRDPDVGLARVSATVADWSGGTRIGESLATLNREHGRRLGRGSIVVILSDGWDRGEPEVLAREMERLRRCAHRVIWLNPLKAQPGYEPLTRGMIAALPRTDRFLAGNNIASLEELAEILEGGS
jgi:xanthine/CO dehydrogenase XdhC/CoxF family maturation factor